MARSWRRPALGGRRVKDAALAGDAIRRRAAAAPSAACYRVRLERAGRSFNRHTSATVMGDGSWRRLDVAGAPTRAPMPSAGARYHLHVAPPGTTFVSGLFRVGGTADTYALDNPRCRPTRLRELRRGHGRRRRHGGGGDRPRHAGALGPRDPRLGAALRRHHRRLLRPRAAAALRRDRAARRPAAGGIRHRHGPRRRRHPGVGRRAGHRSRSRQELGGPRDGAPPNVPRQHWMEEGLATHGRRRGARG
jgi:hypothetical protein